MADPMDVLSVGSFRRIFATEKVENPIVQCLQIKSMQSQGGAPERYRIVFSDTVNFIQSMIAQQTNWIVQENKLKKGSICRLKTYQANFVKEKPILVVVELDVLEDYGELEKLGSPGPLENTKSEEQQDVKPAAPTNISGDGFYGNKPQQAPAAAKPKTKDSTHANIYPIEALSPYAHKWTIKARCTHKSDIKTWHNKNGEGKLFSANFLDDSGEIRATGFKESVDQWYEFLEEGSVYYISAPCRVQLAKKQFSNVNNDYELTFERDTVIEKAQDNDGVPQVRYNFVSLATLESVEKDTTIDTIGILQSVGEVSEIVGKTSSKPFNKRELTIADKSGYSVRLTIWGNTAQTFDTAPESVIAFKGLKVSDFGGRSLSLLSSGSMTVDPDIDEAHKLKGWYDATGRNESYQSHASTMGSGSATNGGRQDQLKTIAQVRDENLGMTENADYFSLKATVIYIKQDNFAYPACRTEGCNKKVFEQEVGEWRCEKCNVAFDKPEWRYVLSINVSDHTGTIWLSCFDDTGRLVMGIPANDAVQIKEDGDQKAVNMFQNANCKTILFRCRAKMDSFQDQQRVRYQVVGAGALNYAVEAKKLAELIKQYSIKSDGMFVT